MFEDDLKGIKVLGLLSILGIVCLGLYVGFVLPTSVPIQEQGLSDSDLNILGSMMLQSSAMTNDCGLLGKTPILVEQEPFQELVSTASQVLACNSGPGTLRSIDQKGVTIEYCETIVSIVGCV